MTDKTKVLFCPVGRECELVEIDNTMEAVQQLVGCKALDVVRPWSPDVGVIIGAGDGADKTKNRWLYREDAPVVRCGVCGAFVVACMPRNTQGVLLPLLAMFADRYKKYMEMYDPNEGDWK